MQCPQCNGACYDNTERVANGWKGPLYKCKDQDGCGWKQFAPKGQRAPAGGAPAPRAPTANGKALGPLYHDCLGFAKAACAHHFGDRATVSDVIAATATLFIQAVRDGSPLRAPKQKPAPKPPPPPPEPEPTYEEADDLPF